MSNPDESKTADQAADLTDSVIDSHCVERFSIAMVEKLARSREKGRGGWQHCPVPVLWEMLREHVEKGDPVDVANLAMMIHHNSRTRL